MAKTTSSKKSKLPLRKDIRRALGIAAQPTPPLLKSPKPTSKSANATSHPKEKMTAASPRSTFKEQTSGKATIHHEVKANDIGKTHSDAGRVNEEKATATSQLTILEDGIHNGGFFCLTRNKKKAKKEQTRPKSESTEIHNATK